MAANNTRASNGHRLSPAGTPFPRFERQQREASGWLALDLGGHEVVSQLHLQMRPGAEAAGEARHSLDRLEGALEQGKLDTLRLLITELITNAVRHSGSDDWIQLDIEIYANAVHARVVDSGSGFQPATNPQPHRDRPGGFGLCLVDRLADRWGVTLDGSTCVWFELMRRPRVAAELAQI